MMGKASKLKLNKQRNQPLAQQIEEDGVAKPNSRVKSKPGKANEVQVMIGS